MAILSPAIFASPAVTAASTMFMVGMQAQASSANKALVERAKQMPLVTVANHSYSHAHDKYRHFYSGTEPVVADMK